MNNQTLNPKTFLIAAEEIQRRRGAGLEGGYVCNLLMEMRGTDSEEVTFFNDLYYTAPYIGYVFNGNPSSTFNGASGHISSKADNHRVFALLLAYEIARGPRKYWPERQDEQ